LTRWNSASIIRWMSPGTSASNGRPLRRGDVVEVRPPAEILATLDADGTLDGVPFMPELLEHVGRRFTVSRRVEKICDTIGRTGSRRMRETVYLEDLRCNGSGHGGCQAGCRIYWKEAWLRRIDASSEPAASSESPDAGLGELTERAQVSTRTERELDGELREVWRCQATEAFNASEPLSAIRDIDQYARELRSGNVGLVKFLRVLARGFVMEFASRVGLLKPTPLHGPGTAEAPEKPLGLKPGDLIEVRSPSEIEATLDEGGLNRRLSFDREMLPYCGKTYRVKDRVERLIDDRTGKMLKISADCLILDGVVCSGERTVGCWFCPRQIYPYWREAWLRPVEGPEARPPKTEVDAPTTAR
jgi:hypothetical protein